MDTFHLHQFFQPRGTRPAKTNTERQREFRKRNPGYYGRLHARQRAAVKALRQAQLAAEANAAGALAAKRQPLMLPAPVERIEIPGMNMIPSMSALNALRAARQPVPVQVEHPSAEVKSRAA